jgi:hypothetical protein
VSDTITRHGLLGELMVAGTADETGIAGTVAGGFLASGEVRRPAMNIKYTGKAAPGVHMIKLMQEREITPYLIAAASRSIARTWKNI